MTILYDNISYNRRMLLDLPFREGIGIVTQDVAKPHHPITMVNTPTWAALDSGKMTINLNGTNEYLQCLSASCTDLDFTSGDFSIGGWLNWTVDEFSQIVIARYELSVSGWELYLYNSGATNLLTLRLHHAAGATTRTGAYSDGWTPGTLWHFGVTRSGTSALFYRNGEPVTTVSDVLIDPETCNQNLVIGCRYTVDSNFYSGPFPRLIVADEALTAEDWKSMYKNQVGLAS